MIEGLKNTTQILVPKMRFQQVSLIMLYVPQVLEL